MRLAIPPLVQTLLAVALVFGLDLLLPDLALSSPYLGIAASSLTIAGFVMLLFAAGLFRRRGTTVDPRFPENSTAIVTDGIYAVSRNPMYLGMALLVSAAIVWTGNLASLTVLPVFVLYMNQFQIKPEEEHLERQFGEQYRNYLQQVRRWL